jgi:hypothetical protein
MAKNQTSYSMGRSICTLGIVLGYAAAALGVLGALGFVIAGPSRVSVLPGILFALLGGGFLAAVNHGLWQALRAVFDIADSQRTMCAIMQGAEQRIHHENAP